MQRIPRDQAMEYEFDHRHPPKLSVKQGESFVVETEDAGSGQVRSPGALTLEHRDGNTRAGSMQSDLNSGEMTLGQGVVSEFTGSN